MVEGLRRVVVTGLGAVTPIGNSVSQYWDGLRTGRNGVAAITLFDASRHPCRFAAEVKDFDPSGSIERKEAKRWDRFCQFAVVAAKEAVAQSGLAIQAGRPERVGVSIGSGVGGLLMMETQAHVLADRGPDRVSPFCVPMMIPNMAAGLTAIALGAKGPSTSASTACAAGSNAIGDAYRLIQLGLADAMVCGGAESAITPLGVAGFASAKALSFRNDDPATASRPFDRERNGFVIGEGAGMVVLESLDHARARGLRSSLRWWATACPVTPTTTRCRPLAGWGRPRPCGWPWPTAGSLPTMWTTSTPMGPAPRPTTATKPPRSRRPWDPGPWPSR